VGIRGTYLDSRRFARSPMFKGMTDIASISQLTQANVAAEVGMKVAVKAKEVAKQQGAAVVSLLESAAELSWSLAIDAGTGGRLDVTA